LFAGFWLQVALPASARRHNPAIKTESKQHIFVFILVCVESLFQVVIEIGDYIISDQCAGGPGGERVIATSPVLEGMEVAPREVKRLIQARRYVLALQGAKHVV
jgi:hypothetical protein